MKKTISKEKFISYIENKRDKLIEQWYSDSLNKIYNNIFYSNQDSFDNQEIVKQLLEVLPREQLKWEHQKISDYLARWIGDHNLYSIDAEIRNRTIKEEEYKKLMEQIEKYWSIIPSSNIRRRDFGGAWWSLILSLSTGKIYDVESDSWAELLKDYKGKQYYSSRSGLSGAWYIYAGKSSLVYLPMMRIDVVHPWSEWWLQEINWLNMAVLTNRGAINEEYPTVIKDCAWVDLVLLSQKSHLDPNGSWKFLWDVIKSKWENLNNLPIKTFTTEYYDENLEKQTLSFTYRTNMDTKDIKFSDMGKWFLGIKRWFDVESTWRFIDNTIWIRKYKDKYVRLWTFWLIKEVFDSYPIQQEEDKLYIDEIEIWTGNIIERTKIEIPLSNDYTGNINGREIRNNLAVRKDKREKIFSWYEFEKKCKEHWIDPNEIYEWFDEDQFVESKNIYNLIYEKKLSDINPEYQNLDSVFMEYEEDIPWDIFEKYPRAYREEYMAGKLADKAYNERSNYNNRPESTQKEIAKVFLMENPEVKLVLQDSYAVGNCEPWTKGFMHAFELDEQWVLAKDLLKHKHLDRMMKESRFRAVLLRKVLEATFIQ